MMLIFFGKVSSLSNDLVGNYIMSEMTFVVDHALVLEDLGDREIWYGNAMYDFLKKKIKRS